MNSVGITGIPFIEVPPMKLTARQIDTAKFIDKLYKLSDGGGLYLEVANRGSHYWRLKYRYAGNEPGEIKKAPVGFLT